MTEDAEPPDEIAEKQTKDDEADIFLGSNPSTDESLQISLSNNLASRIKSWTVKGLLDKEEK